MKKILVIDDDISICRTIDLYLGDKLHVLSANSAKEGLSVFEKESPPVVILDIKLPDLSGLEVLKILKNIDATVCVIIITAFQDMETTIEAIKNGAFDYISKPINTNEFDLSIQRAFHTLELHKKLKDLQDEVYAN
ncbi:MAG: response regulator, partial [Deltaproteobacteria bacterium]|nr:response regulator [Deltaproteobacteria bacterium]